MNKNCKRVVIMMCILIIITIVIYFIKIEGFNHINDPVLREIRTQLATIHPSFKTIEVFEGDRSYTINKKKIYLCLKDPNGRYYSRNMLVYVLCHEFAHTLCDELNHTDKFYDIFSDVLDKAKKMGLYNENIPLIMDYCGT